MTIITKKQMTVKRRLSGHAAETEYSQDVNAKLTGDLQGACTDPQVAFCFGCRQCVFQVREIT